MRTRLFILVALLALCTQVNATATYSYVGGSLHAYHNDTPPAGTYDGSMHLTGFIVLLDPLAANGNWIWGANVEILRYSFSDGRNTITSGSPLSTLHADFYGTDEFGIPTSWSLSAGTDYCANWHYNGQCAAGDVAFRMFSSTQYARDDTQYFVLAGCFPIGDGRYGCVADSDMATGGLGTWSVTISEPGTLSLVGLALLALPNVRRKLLR